MPETKPPPPPALLAAIHQYVAREPAPDIAPDALRDIAFDRLTHFAARLFDVPVALLALAPSPQPGRELGNGPRPRVKFRAGVAADSARADAEALFCADVAGGASLLVVDDTAAISGSPASPFRFCAGTPLPTESGPPPGVLAIFDSRPRALTARDREMFEALAVMVADRLTLDGAARGDEPAPLVAAREERIAAMGTLAAGVAHEINNPLTYIMANIGFVTERLNKLKRSLTPSPPGGSAGPLAVLAEQLEELVTALGEAQEGALRVRKIVRDLKIFAWSDQERYGAVDVRAAIEAAATMTAADITARARLVKELHPVPPVMASESRLGQVFLNLITNAVQAIKEGHPAENEIRISTGTDAMGRVVVVVADTGAGIPPEVMRRIFDPFFTTKPLGIGTGLGLYICHGIVRALGGELTVESEPGRGSRFRVALPAVLPP